MDAGTHRATGTSRDIYAEAIPLDELIESARAHIEECAAQDEASIRRCAEHVVREKTCACVTTQATIVDALVADFVGRLHGPRRPQG